MSSPWNMKRIHISFELSARWSFRYSMSPQLTVLSISLFLVSQNLNNYLQLQHKINFSSFKSGRGMWKWTMNNFCFIGETRKLVDRFMLYYSLPYPPSSIIPTSCKKLPTCMISAVVSVSMSVQGHQLASSGKWRKKK